jgi:hypothetical protein
MNDTSVLPEAGVDVSHAALVQRLEAAKRDRVLEDRVARMADLHEAVAEVFRWMGFTTYVASGTEDGGRWSNRRYVTAVVLDSTTILIQMPGPGDGADWRRTQPNEDTKQAKIAKRANTVWNAAHILIGQRKDLQRMLALDDYATTGPLGLPPASSSRAWWGLVLTCWWQARIAEGHSPESARMLMALIAHPHLLRAFPDIPVRLSGAV